MNFMVIIPATSPKRLKSEITFSNYLLIVDAYSKIPKLYVMEIITTEEVMDKLYMFQFVFGKIDKFAWWDLEITSAIQVRSLLPQNSRTNVKPAVFGLR